jgi:hypothetical protein
MKVAFSAAHAPSPKGWSRAEIADLGGWNEPGKQSTGALLWTARLGKDNDPI